MYIVQRPVRAEVLILYYQHRVLLPLQGANAMAIITQGVAMGYEIHWAFSPLKLKAKLELLNKGGLNLSIHGQYP